MCIHTYMCYITGTSKAGNLWFLLIYKSLLYIWKFPSAQFLELKLQVDLENFYHETFLKAAYNTECDTSKCKNHARSLKAAI